MCFLVSGKRLKEEFAESMLLLCLCLFFLLLFDSFESIINHLKVPSTQINYAHICDTLHLYLFTKFCHRKIVIKSDQRFLICLTLSTSPVDDISWGKNHSDLKLFLVYFFNLEIEFLFSLSL